MKDREKALLTYILEHDQTTIKDLMQKFKISKRTLYYDIESLNFLIHGNGQLKNIDRKICYVGNAPSLKKLLHTDHDPFLDPQERKDYILYKILNQESVTIEKLADEMMVSKNTVVQTIDQLKLDLKKQGLVLVSKSSYDILGDEMQIRNLYLMLMQDDNNLLNTDITKVQQFDELHQLHLSDYATFSLAKFLIFLRHRFAQNRHIKYMPYEQEIQSFPYYENAWELLECHHELEQMYVCAYIASLPSLDTEVSHAVADLYVERLIERFEAASAIVLERRDEFKKNIRRHLLSSYYRIKYRFPINNPTLNEIKTKHGALFTIIKRILDNENDFPDFKGIRDEEIGFIVAYFGGYLKGSEQEERRKNRVLLVCPHGLMVSKSLEVQLMTYIPMIQIVDVIALKDLKQYPKTYDYIISTIELTGYQNVIVVNPLMTRMDIDLVMETLLHIRSGSFHLDLDEIIESIKQNATIIDEAKLRKDLERLIYQKEKKEINQPMLKEVLTKERIQVIEHVGSWKEAIQLASKPLLSEQAIEQEYVDAMIDSVEAHGPYIVLADGFALPHASSASGVHELSMALLVVKEPVDLLGKPVRLFMVLATTDNTSHMKALASLTNILYEPNNMNVFYSGDIDSIMQLVESSE